MDVKLGEGAVLADGRADDTEWGGPEGGVDVVVVLAVDALWYLGWWLVVGGWWSSANSGVSGFWWKRTASGGWWLVLGK